MEGYFGCQDSVSFGFFGRQGNTKLGSSGVKNFVLWMSHRNLQRVENQVKKKITCISPLPFFLILPYLLKLRRAKQVGSHGCSNILCIIHFIYASRWRLVWYSIKLRTFPNKFNRIWRVTVLEFADFSTSFYLVLIHIPKCIGTFFYSPGNRIAMSSFHGWAFSFKTHNSGKTITRITRPFMNIQVTYTEGLSNGRTTVAMRLRIG